MLTLKGLSVGHIWQRISSSFDGQSAIPSEKNHVSIEYGYIIEILLKCTCLCHSQVKHIENVLMIEYRKRLELLNEG